MRAALAQLVTELVATGEVSAASVVVGDSQGPLGAARAGWRDRLHTMAVRRFDRFDLASLTKPWTATLALALDRRGLVPLGLRLGEVWPLAPVPLARQELEALLRHRSGLPAWRPLYRELRNANRVVERLLTVESPGAAKPTYSDLGYILWARTVEALTGESLEVLMRRHVLRPLGLSTVETAPDSGRCVASLLDNDREVELAAALNVAVARRKGPPRGVVQDGNARFLGGLPGHAGLFAPAQALWRLGAEWLQPSGVLTPGAVESALSGTGRYRQGWWRRNAAPKAAGPLGASSYGHHGFTGGSLWIDPDRGRIAVLLAHRVASRVDLDPWRRRLHRLALS